LSDIRKAKIVFFISLLLIFGGLGIIWSSRFYVSWHMESGSDWWQFETETTSVSVNSTYPSVNYSINQVILNITHFNVSEGSVSLLIYDENGSLLLNRTGISGNMTSGYASHDELPDLSVDPRNFTLAFLWEGTNTTVDFEYEKYGILFWDGVPYAVPKPGYYEFIGIGSSLIIIAVIPFVWAVWKLRIASRTDVSSSAISEFEKEDDDEDGLQNGSGPLSQRQTSSMPLIILAVFQITRAVLSFLTQYRIFMWGLPTTTPSGEIFAPNFPVAINPIYLFVGVIDILFMTLILLLDEYEIAYYLLILLDILLVFAPIWLRIGFGFGYRPLGFYYNIDHITGISIISLLHIGFLLRWKLRADT
jgi:hypothetical protein